MSTSHHRQRRSRAQGLWIAVLLFGLTAIPLLTLPSEHPLRLLWSPLLALGVVFLTRRAALGLFLAGFAGCLLLTQGHPLQAASLWLRQHAWPSLMGSWTPGHTFSSLPSQWHQWHLGALCFTLLLGSFAAVLERGGGLQHILFRSADDTRPHPRRRFLLSVYGLGLLCFFDGLANSLMVGRVARGISDRLHISRTMLAYLVDTTSSAVACVAFISTWIAVQLSLIQDGVSSLALEQPAYLLFLSSIPRNYYCLFALVLAFLVLFRGWWTGAMQRIPTEQTEAPLSQNKNEPVALWRALFPIVILISSILAFYYFLHPAFASADKPAPPRFPITLEAVQLAFGSNAGPSAFILGSSLALLSAVALFPRARRNELPHTIVNGARQLLPSLLILLLAWIFGSIIKAQGTDRMIASLLEELIPLRLFPAAVFLTACLTSFVSGTSWGTMALLMPLVLPALGPIMETQDLPPQLLHDLVPSVIAAVFGGAVFGDHCSPFSDTTIISALACGIPTPLHTLTQLPYALLTAGVALTTGYSLEALGLSPWLALLVGILTLAAITSLPLSQSSPSETSSRESS